MCKCLQLVAHGRGAILTRHLCETLRQNRNTWLCSLQTRCHFGSKPALKKELFADFERAKAKATAKERPCTSRSPQLGAGSSRSVLMARARQMAAAKLPVGFSKIRAAMVDRGKGRMPAAGDVPVDGHPPWRPYSGPVPDSHAETSRAFVCLGFCWDCRPLNLRVWRGRPTCCNPGSGCWGTATPGSSHHLCIPDDRMYDCFDTPGR